MNQVDEISHLRWALTEILNLTYPQRNPDGDNQYVETVRLIASDALARGRPEQR